MLSAAVLLAAGGYSLSRRLEATQPDIGVEWVESADGPLAFRVEQAGAAWAAGVRPGDILLRAGGSPVSGALEAGELGWTLAGGRPLPLELRRGDRVFAAQIAAQVAPRREPYAYLAIVGLAFGASGAFIGLRWPTVRGGRLYVLLAGCLFIELTFSTSGTASAADWTIFWTDVAAEALAPALLLHWAFVMSRRVRGGRALSLLAYGLAALLFLANVWLVGLGGVYRFAPRLALVELPDRLMILYLAVAFGAALAVLFRAYERSASALHRGQLRWLIWGLGVGLGPFVVLYGLPWSLGAAELPAWAQLLAVMPMLVLPAACTSALARYRLHDLDVFLLRGVTEVTAVLCAFAVLAAVELLAREGLANLIPLSRGAARYTAILVAVVAYPGVRAAVRAGVERAIYRKRYSYRATLLDWARELAAETDLSSLLQRLRARIRATLDVPEAEVLLALDEHVAQRLDSEAHVALGAGGLAGLPWARHLFAMKVEGQLRAALVVAERPEPEEPLSSEDRALLGTLAAQAASALEAARLVQEVRRRAEEIERLHARQAKILESSAVGLLMLDGEGRIQAWNRALEASYGLPRGEALGRTLAEVFPLHVAVRIARERQTPELRGEARIFRLGLVNRAGRRVLANVAISPVDAEHDDGSRVVTFDDVTERVKLEEQVLRQERLASLGLLAAGVAHEVNTPLTGISSYTQMLLEGCAADDARRPVLEKIEAQTRRASRITHSLLNLARPEGGGSEWCDVRETIQDVLQLFEPQLRGRGVQIESTIENGLPQIRGERGRLQQVLLNLLINARDAVGERGRITVEAYRRQDKVVIDVQDDGAGIAEDDLPRIFDPFFTTKGRGKGTGLGLSISYGIVQEHGGEILVESTPGEFTRFRVELPVVRSAQALA
ncbi:MAG TPA: ATP-binding protein [Candidatus Polarisedimenticolaceae bacterium]|nr:ATP-binding protein [Candidatus Polarisedimenticolaceae bacterium]